MFEGAASAEMASSWQTEYLPVKGRDLLRDCHVDELIESYSLCRGQTRDRRTANDQSKVAVKCPTLFDFGHVEQGKPLFAGRISETIVKRHYFQ